MRPGPWCSPRRRSVSSVTPCWSAISATAGSTRTTRRPALSWARSASRLGARPRSPVSGGLAFGNGVTAGDAGTLYFLRPPILRNDERDVLADRLRGGPAEEPLRGGVPGRDDSVECLAHDHVVRRC